MQNMVFLVGSLIVIGLWVYGGIWQKNNERVGWNNGYCKKCGSEWVCFDMDSQGGRMYSCKGGHYCDVSYNVDGIKIW